MRPAQLLEARVFRFGHANEVTHRKIPSPGITNRLVSSLQQRTPDLDPNVVIFAGARLRAIIYPAGIEGAPLACNQVLDAEFYAAVEVAVLTIVGSATMEWKNTKGAKAGRGCMRSQTILAVLSD